MNNTVLIVLLLSVCCGLFYFLYTLVLDMDKKPRVEADLQISPEDVLKQSQILFEQKKYLIIENLASKYLERNPLHVELRTLLAKTYFEDVRFEKAIKEAKEALKTASGNISLRILLANAYRKNGQSSLAISELNDILQIDEDNIVAVKLLAQILYDTNQKQSALKMYEHLDELVDNNIERLKVETTIAQILTETARFEEAIEQYNQILEIYPEDVNIKKNLIELYKQTQNEVKAIEFCQSLYEYSSESSDGVYALETLVDLYLKLANPDDALKAANLLSGNRLANKVTAKKLIAKTLSAQGKKDESIQILLELALQNPESIALRKQLANTYIEKEDFATALSIYKEILNLASVQEVPEIHREISNIYADWATFLFRAEDSSECFKKFNLAIQYDSENPELYYQIGKVNQLIKNFNEAISQFKKALEISPTFLKPYIPLAECFEDINNIYELKRTLLNAVKYDSGNKFVYYKLGTLAFDQHDFSGAETFFADACKIDPDYVEAEYKYALTLEALGQREKAIELYEKILSTDPDNENAKENLNMLKSV